MKSMKTLFIVLIVPVLAFSATTYVPDHYPTIQGAIDAAANGDTIIVRPGTYNELIDFTGKAITLSGENGAQNTVIDGNQLGGSVVTCKSGEGSDTVLNGFTITRGCGQYAAGMFIDHSNPRVIGCTFFDNQAYNGVGGGMYNASGNPVISDCTFSSNHAELGGGGIFNVDSDPVVTNCTFYSNCGFFGNGGGMVNDNSSPVVVHCKFINNWASEGGGMSSTNSSTIVENCLFSGNFGVYSGGGLLNSGGTLSVINCIFSDNWVDLWLGDGGGGMCNRYCDVSVINCIFTNNSAAKAEGGGMANNNCNSSITNCLFSKNLSVIGGGISNIVSTPTVTNCIIWENIPDEIYGNAIVTYSDVKGGYPGMGNIDSDPLFVDPANNDFHISFLSPCRGSGDNSVVTELFDFEGDPRIYQGTVDIGADEFYTHLYVTGDKTPCGAIQGKFVGSPGTTPVGLFIGSSVLPTPATTMWGEYWLQAPWFLFPLVPIPSNGILELPTTLPGSIPAPYDIPMQALIGLNADSLSNVCLVEVR